MMCSEDSVFYMPFRNHSSFKNLTAIFDFVVVENLLYLCSRLAFFSKKTK